MSYKQITAKFDSECDGCGRGIDAGDSMYWANGAPPRCVDCGAGGSDAGQGARTSTEQRTGVEQHALQNLGSLEQKLTEVQERVAMLVRSNAALVRMLKPMQHTLAALDTEQGALMAEAMAEAEQVMGASPTASAVDVSGCPF